MGGKRCHEGKKQQMSERWDARGQINPTAAAKRKMRFGILENAFGKEQSCAQKAHVQWWRRVLRALKAINGLDLIMTWYRIGTLLAMAAGQWNRVTQWCMPASLHLSIRMHGIYWRLDKIPVKLALKEKSYKKVKKNRTWNCLNLINSGVQKWLDVEQRNFEWRDVVCLKSQLFACVKLKLCAFMIWLFSLLCWCQLQ